MGRIAIQVEGLSKRYRLGQRVPYQALRDILAATASSTLHQVSQAARRQPSGPRLPRSSEYIWALKNISFEIQRGAATGIIGRNGAGKSTFLKIISRITRPTEGYAEIHGRVGSLLEVGTGFHPELTGRENIYLNGAILGMQRAEIDRKFDAIVAFSEVERFIDTPVKHYSSGMYMRLAFAVAAHLEPEILVVDEVLAVGDLAFQQKCLGKMDTVAKEGRTVLFVSHNLDAIQRLCSQCILFDQGQVVEYGECRPVVAHYLSTNSYQARPQQWIDLSQVSRIGTGAARFAGVQYSSLNPQAAFQPYTGGPVEFDLVINSDKPMTVGSLAVTIYNQFGTKLVDTDTNAIGQALRLEQGSNFVKLRIEKLYLNPGVYRLGLWLADPISSLHSQGAYDFIESAFEIEVYSLQDKHIGVTSEAVVPCEYSLVETAAPAGFPFAGHSFPSQG